jgi:hypothetical protein
MRTRRSRLLALVVSAFLYACAAPLAESQPGPEHRVVTAAEVFEAMLRQKAEQRLKRQAENKKRPLHRKSRQSQEFDLLDLQIEDWHATEEGRFAHSIRIPNPVPEDSGYRPGMTQQEYFEHLCRNEAGEFIFRTVDNVDGIYQLRPRKIYSPAEWQHLYAIEDPYGYWPGEAENVGFTFAHPTLYSFYEIPVSGVRRYPLSMKTTLDASLHAAPPPGAKVARYAGNDGVNWRSMKLEYDTQPKARYAFTWRGIKRPSDRELGIAGGELIVLDRQTNEVLGVRRGYVVWNRGWTGRVCPKYGYGGGQDKTTYFSTWFIAKVARPSRWQEFFAEEEKYRRPR